MTSRKHPLSFSILFLLALLLPLTLPLNSQAQREVKESGQPQKEKNKNKDKDKDKNKEKSKVLEPKAPGGNRLKSSLASGLSENFQNLQNLEENQYELSLLSFDGDFPTALTSNLFKTVRPAIFQIKTSLDAYSPKASYCSAFVLMEIEGGILVTNYHCVAQALLSEEDQYKIFLVNKGESIPLKIVGIDSTHDLAILKADGRFLAGLKLSDRAVKKGEKIFSVGLPKDLNIAITEGNFNGPIKYGIYEQILMSSPINSGMSGGPTINRRGHVVGVNVSVLLNSQNISFSVPIKYVRKLLDEYKKSLRENKPLDVKNNVHQILEQQLLKVQDSLMEDMYKNISNVSNIDQWRVAPTSQSLKCWSSYKNELSASIKKHLQSCSLRAKSYIKEDIRSGDYEIHHTVIRNKKRNTFQFYHLLQQIYNHGQDSSNKSIEQKDMLTAAKCSEEIITNEHKVTFKINYCLQGYIKFPQLYVLNFKSLTLSKENKSSLILRAILRGYTFENIKKFINYQLSQIKIEDQK